MTIKEYYAEIERLTLRLGVCLNWSEEMCQMKVQEAFINGLSKRCQLEMARLNIRECVEIYSVINSTEETMIEQMKTANTKHKHKKKVEPKNEIQTTQPRKYSNNNQKYCDFHKVHTHDSAECRAKPKSNNKELSMNQRSNNTFVSRKL